MPALMKHYQDADYITKLRAKFFLCMALVILIFLPIIIGYTIQDIPGAPLFTNRPLIMVEVLTLAATAVIAYLLYQGQLTFAAHTLLPFALLLTWTGMLLDRSHVISCLDSVVWILALMGMSPLTVTRNKTIILLYTAANLAALALFAFVQSSNPDLPSYALRDFILDTCLAMIFIGITSYNVFAINHAALAQAEADIAARQTVEQKLALQNALLAAQTEASIDGILFIDRQRCVISYNSRFARLWELPTEILASGSDKLMLDFAKNRTSDPEAFITTTEEIYAQPQTASHDEFKFKDGRIIERYSEAVNGEAGEYLGRVWFMRDITNRRRNEEHLRASEERYRAVVEDQTEMIARFTSEGAISFVNAAARRFFENNIGRYGEYVGRNIREFIHLTQEDSLKNYLSRFSSQAPNDEIEQQYLNTDGSLHWTVWTARALYDSRGEIAEFQAVGRDITDKKLAEQERERLSDQLRQAQKMESIGRLAGGIAHDFNNLLTAIGGNLELALLALTHGKPAEIYLTEAHMATDSAANLTRQLLAFSRKQIIAPQILDLHQLIRQLSDLLRRVIGEHIYLETDLAAAHATIKADPGQIEQIVMNLAVNARDAMPEGGRLVIATTDALLDDSAYRDDANLRVGPHIKLSVADTGCGMAPLVLEHLFEPFFTTKPHGKGTGLGLATTYGAVMQNGGAIKVESTPGRGSTFTILLPVAEGEAQPATKPTGYAALPSGNETVLLVEDDPLVLTAAQGILEHLGYTVHACSSAEEALGLSDDELAPISVLLADMVLPGMNGRDLAKTLSDRKPHLRTLFSSGYTDDLLALQDEGETTAHFIAKPYSANDLAIKLREILA